MRRLILVSAGGALVLALILVGTTVLAQPMGAAGAR